MGDTGDPAGEWNRLAPADCTALSILHPPEPVTSRTEILGQCNSVSGSHPDLTFVLLTHLYSNNYHVGLLFLFPSQSGTAVFQLV